jgi:pimeloyl-ACP methyl ester carboxylesterase
MPYLELTGARLYYETAGTGPRALCFIPAGICTCAMWKPQIDAFTTGPLAEQYRCITFDPRGYGQTEMTSAAAYSNRNDIDRLLDHLGIGRAVLIGCSRGGAMAVDYALEHPFRVTGLVPVCAGLTGIAFEPSEAEHAVFSEMDALEAAGDTDALIEREIDIFLVGFNRTRADVDPQLIETVRAMQHINARHAQAGEQHHPIVMTPPAIERLRDIKAPTLVVLGLEDDGYAHAVARKLATDIPNAQLVALDSTAHLPSLERPEAFNAALSAFLRDLG